VRRLLHVHACLAPLTPAIVIRALVGLFLFPFVAVFDEICVCPDLHDVGVFLGFKIPREIGR